jgi:hypothetical protein
MPYDLFISHSSIDRKIADAICHHLEERGIRCWVAPRDLAPGESWAAGIVNGLEKCRAMVLIFSEHSNRSEHVAREIERAVSKSVVIFPFRIDATPMRKELEYFISATHWLDAMTEPVEQHIEALGDAVARQFHTPGDPARPQPQAPAPLPFTPTSRLTRFLQSIWREACIPAWRRWQKLTMPFKILLGGIVAILAFQLSISSRLAPPSESQIRRQMAIGEELTKSLMEETANLQRKSELTQDLSNWAYQSRLGTTLPPWWEQELNAFRRDLSEATALDIEELSKRVEPLTARTKSLEAQLSQAQTLEATLSSLRGWVTIRGAMNPDADQTASASTLESIKNDLQQGRLEAAQQTLAPFREGLQSALSLEESLMRASLHTLSDNSSFGLPNITEEQLTAYVKNFRHGWGLSFRGLKLGMTPQEVQQWARDQGAIWVGGNNFTGPDRRLGQEDTNAVIMQFTFPLSRPSMRMGEAALSFTQHLSEAEPSALHQIEITGYEEAGKKAQDFVESLWGKASRLVQGELIYSGNDIYRESGPNLPLPEISSSIWDANYSRWRLKFSYYPLEHLRRDQWGALVAQSRTIADLPANPAWPANTSGAAPGSLILLENDWKLPLSIDRAELEALAATQGAEIHQNENQTTVKWKNGSLRALANMTDKPNSLSFFEVTQTYTDPPPFWETIEAYMRKYGPPAALSLSEHYISWSYLVAGQNQSFEIHMNLKGDKCLSSRLEMGYDP